MKTHQLTIFLLKLYYFGKEPLLSNIFEYGLWSAYFLYNIRQSDQSLGSVRSTVKGLRNVPFILSFKLNATYFRRKGQLKTIFCKKNAATLADHLISMSEFVAVYFAFVGPDDVEQVVFSQELVSDVRAKVRSGTAETVGHTPVGALRVAPQDVKDLDKQSASIIYIYDTSCPLSP